MNLKEHNYIKRQLKIDLVKARERKNDFEIANCKRGLHTLEAIRKAIK